MQFQRWFWWFGAVVAGMGCKMVVGYSLLQLQGVFHVIWRLLSGSNYCLQWVARHQEAAARVVQPWEVATRMV